MTLPANDAFTLGLTGKHDSTRPSYPLSLRSTSPKIPFVSGTKSSVHYSSDTANSRMRSPLRSMSNGSANSHDTPSLIVANGGHKVEHHPHPSSNGVPRRQQNKGVEARASAPIDWEIPRKTLHSSIGFLTIYLYTSHGSPRFVVVVLTLALCIIIPADVLRLNSSRFERVYERCLGFLMRESEKKGTNGVIWYIIGAIFALSMYPLDVAVVSILILSWADTAASTIGRMFGSLTPPLPRRVPLLGLPFASRKSVAGFIAGSLAGAAIAAGFWGWISPLGNIQPMWSWTEGPTGSVAVPGSISSRLLTGWAGLGLISVVSGLVSGVAEALDLGSLDDNLTLPIISGGCLWGFLKFLSFLSS